MAPIKDRQSLFEIGITLMLISLMLAPALSPTLNLALVLGHWLFLSSVALFALEAARRLHPVAGSLLFSLITGVLAIEILVQQLTGLHLNGFTLSLMFESGWRENIGLSFTAILAPLALIGLSFFLARTRPRQPLRLPLRPTLLATLAGVILAQSTYAVLHFRADTHVMETRRKLPFFAAIHPYRAQKILQPFLGERPLNPFALSRAKAAAAPMVYDDLNITRPRNIVLIIADSIRATDIRIDPNVAPNIAALNDNQQLSLSHYAASNCTHFSIYSMLTGELPTGYEAARRAAAPLGLMPWLQEAGYTLSSAEALSLDWYDLSTLLLTPATRAIADDGTAAERDRFVTETTIRKIEEADDKPFFHLAYYNGAHFPYGDNDPLPGLAGGTPASYRAAVRAADAEIGRVLDAVARHNDKDTLVIVTSDHGEAVFENGVVGHASELSDEQMIVPFGVMGEINHPLPTSQLGIADFILAELGARTVKAPSSVLLSNCSYAFPNGFAVIDGEKRADFVFEDGFLSPVPSPDGKMPTKAFQLDAAQQLVEAINTNSQE